MFYVRGFNPHGLDSRTGDDFSKEQGYALELLTDIKEVNTCIRTA
jgi:hypothetical protein